MNEYEKQANDLCINHHVFITFKNEGTGTRDIAGKPREYGIYKVIISRRWPDMTPQKVVARAFKLHGSVADYEKGTLPTAYDILTSVKKYEVGTLQDFVDNYGYEIDMSNVEDSIDKLLSDYSALREEYNKVLELFGDILKELWGIQ
jgi:hypothetical protein